MEGRIDAAVCPDNAEQPGNVLIICDMADTSYWSVKNSLTISLTSSSSSSRILYLKHSKCVNR